MLHALSILLALAGPQEPAVPELATLPAEIRSYYEYRSEQVDADAVRVDVDRIEIGPSTNAFFIAQYLEKGKDAPTPLDLAARISRSYRLAQATHRWLRVGGEWRRESTTRVLVSR